MDEVMYGKCDCCGKSARLKRTYFYYDVQCDCRICKEDKHFELVNHCKDCNPTAPSTIQVTFDNVTPVLEDDEVKTPLHKSIDMLRKHLKEDADYYMGWQSNIAMAFIDNNTLNIKYEELHKLANKAAKSFLDLLIM